MRTVTDDVRVGFHRGDASRPGTHHLTAERTGQISGQTGFLVGTAEKGSEATGGWAERGKDADGKTRDAVSRGAEEAQQYVRDAADAMK